MVVLLRSPVNTAAMGKPDSVNNISARSPHVEQLISHSRRLKRLTVHLREHLSGLVASHVSVANVSEETLTVMVDSPAWATRLRFQTRQILADMSRYCTPYTPRNLRVMVRPQQQRAAPRQPRSAAAMSKSSAEGINGLVQCLPENDPLRLALERLASHHLHDDQTPGDGL